MENTDFSRRFSNCARLYGDAFFSKIQNAHVAVVGLGGVGSWAAEALVRSGIGALTLIDLDHLSPSNTNRQLHALDPFYGLPKIVVLKERFLNISPQMELHLVEDFLNADNCDSLLPHNLSGILDCTDDVSAKIALILKAKKSHIPLVVSGGAGGKTDPSLMVCADLSQSISDPLLANLRRRLRKFHAFPPAGKKMQVEVVFSKEVLKRPVVCSNGNLNCSGLGSSVVVTASFGFLMVAQLFKQWEKQCAR